jgi:ParB-like chromosome segregation protein Spo0J
MVSKLKDAQKRGNLLYYLPEDLLLSEVGKSGRVHEVTDAEVQKKAISILKYGQVEPIRIGNDKGKPYVIVGRTRTRAIALINSGWLPIHWKDIKATNKGVEDPELPLSVACQLSKGSPESDLLLSIEENRQRNNTNPLDDWHNQKRLKEEMEYTDEQIAEVYGCTPMWVARLRKLDNVTEDVRNAVADGTMGVDAAIEMAEIPKEDQQEVLEELEQEAESATTSNGKPKKSKGKKSPKASGKGVKRKITTAAVKAKTRAARQKAGKGGTTRSLKELKEFYVSLATKSESVPLSTLCDKIVQHMTSKLSDDLMIAWLKGNVSVKQPKKPMKKKAPAKKGK